MFWKTVVFRIYYTHRACDCQCLALIFRMVFAVLRILCLSQEKEETKMNCKANKCIECTVSQCAYHCDEANYCSLDRILVGTHETNPTMDQCTDCKSFRKK